MSDYLRLLPSGLAIASGEDTFLTQLLNDNIRRMEKQLPCCCKIKINGFFKPGTPLCLESNTPPTAGKTGPFLGILTHTPDAKTHTGVVQVAGLALVNARASVGSFLYIKDGKVASGIAKDAGAENLIGNVVAMADNEAGLPLVYVLLRSWCGERGAAYREDGNLPCAGFGAEPRPSGRQQFVAGTAHVKGTSLRGFPFISSTGKREQNSVWFDCAQMTNIHAQPADCMYKVHVTEKKLYVKKRLDNKDEIETDIYVMGTIK